MKAALVQNAIPSSTGVQTFSHSIFNGDLRAALLFGTRATTNNLLTQHGALCLGATDKTRAYTMSSVIQDGVANAVSSSYANVGRVYSMAEFAGGSAAEADLSGVSHPSNGIQIAWDDIDNQQLVNALLLGGDDVEVSVVTPQLGSSVNTVTVDHQLSGPPDVMIAFGNDTGAGGSGSNGIAMVNIGFYVRADDAYMSLTRGGLNGSAVQNDCAKLSTEYIASRLINSNLTTQLTFANITATQFDVQRTGSTNQTSLAVICIRGRNAPLQAKAGTFDTPTETGEFDAITGMSSTPDVVIFVPTRLEAVDETSITDNAGHSGLGIAVRSSGAEACAIESSDDGSDPVDANCYTSANRAAFLLNTDGTELFGAAVSEWTPDGLRLFTAIAPTNAKKVAYLAFGMPDPINTLKPRANTLLRM